MAVIKFGKKVGIKAVSIASHSHPNWTIDLQQSVPGSIEHILALVRVEIARRRKRLD